MLNLFFVFVFCCCLGFFCEWVRFTTERNHLVLLLLVRSVCVCRIILTPLNICGIMVMRWSPRMLMSWSTICLDPVGSFFFFFFFFFSKCCIWFSNILHFFRCPRSRPGEWRYYSTQGLIYAENADEKG